MVAHKQHYRIIDWKRTKDGIPAVVERLEYDPNRTANIALLKYADGERRYIIAPKGVHAGDELMSGGSAPIRSGNTLALRNIPVGSVIHCVELKPGKGAQMVRSAGGSCQLVAREGTYATLRMRSGEMRRVLSECRATLGEVGNSEHSLRSLGKAGANRWRGKRPTVRGVAMNQLITHMAVVKAKRLEDVIQCHHGACQRKDLKPVRTSARMDSLFVGVESARAQLNEIC